VQFLTKNTDIGWGVDCQLHFLAGDLADLDGNAECRKDDPFVATSGEDKHGDASYAGSRRGNCARHKIFSAKQVPTKKRDT
jgi:hypothetical protein